MLIHLPIRGVRLGVPALSDFSVAHLQNIIDAPPVTRAVVYDDVDIPIAYDMVLNDGFYLIVLWFFVLSFTRRVVLKQVK